MLFYVSRRMTLSHKNSGLGSCIAYCTLSAGVTSLYDVVIGGQAIPEFLLMFCSYHAVISLKTGISGHFGLIQSIWTINLPVTIKLLIRRWI